MSKTSQTDLIQDLQRQNKLLREVLYVAQFQLREVLTFQMWPDIRLKIESVIQETETVLGQPEYSDDMKRAFSAVARMDTEGNS